MDNNEIEETLNAIDQEFAIANTHFLILKELEPITLKSTKEEEQFFSYWVFDLITHTKGFFVSISKFFDKDTRNVSLYNLLEENPNLKAKFQCDYDALEGKFDVYRTEYRNKVVAHMSKNKKLTSATLPNLTFLDDNELGDFVKNIKILINNLRTEIHSKTSWFSYYSDVDYDFKMIKYSLNEYKKQIAKKLEEYRKKQ